MTAKTKLPEYLTEGDGFIDVTLARGLTVSGVVVKSLRMREPTLNDHLVFEATKGSDLLKEATMVANLCDQDVADIRTMPSRDYKRTVEALGNLIG